MDWSFIDDNSIDDACLEFTNKLITIAENNIPHKQVTIRPNDKPWYDSEIRKYSRLRDRLKRKSIQTKLPNDWIKYKQLRNKVNNLKKHAKETFFGNLENSLNDLTENNPKKYWKTIKTLIKDSNTATTIPPLKLDNNDFAFSDEEKANALNNFFASISTINNTNTVLPPFIPKSPNIMEDFEITEQEVIDILRNLDVKKATGPDAISHYLLKYSANTICKPLCKLFNKSLSNSYFPSEWKSANVIPLFKKGDKSEVSNYRPISLISCVGKVME